MIKKNAKKALKKPIVEKSNLDTKTFTKHLLDSDDSVRQISNHTEKDEVIIELNNVTKAYGKQVILENISVKVYKGDRIGIIGPNGEGKSTIAEILTRIKQPTSGKVIYPNKNLIVGIQFQESNYPQGVKGRTMIEYYIDAYKINPIKLQLDKLIEYFDLRDLLDKSINSLSGGQKQRLNIFLSVMNDPDLILLDELTTGLDIEAADRMRDIIQKRILTQKDKSLLLVTHTMDEVESICNRLWFIYDKKILFDMPVSKIIGKYGSVSEFTEKVFDEIRHELDEKKKKRAEEFQRKNAKKFAKQNAKEKKRNAKMEAIFKKHEKKEAKKEIKRSK